jgi:hypothetical protein
MPRQIPYYDLLFHSIRYLLNRQVVHRPTTLYQLSKRMGYGVEHLQGLLEAERVEYVLVSHGEKLDDKTTEILIRSIPETVVVELGVGNPEIEAAFISTLDNIEPIAKLDLPESNVQMVDLVDPLAKYRIQDRTFEIMKPELLRWQEVNTKLVRKGYAKMFFRDRFLEGKLYEELSPVWRPFYYGVSTYFLRKCLQHVHELDQFFKVQGGFTKNKLAKNRRKRYEPQNPFLFTRKSI